MQSFYSADQIFTGTELLSSFVIVENNGIVEALIPSEDIDPSRVIHHAEKIIAPAFIDLQVYGASGKLLAEFPSSETLKIMEENFLAQGCILFQPTVATNTTTVFKACIDAVRHYREQGGNAVHGLHIEGPWINDVKRGAHVAEWVHRPEKEEVMELLEYGKGIISMITIAPEVCDEEIIELILSNGILISAGHSNADYTRATHAFDKGVMAVTHLYNAMSGLHHREPGLVGAAFNHKEVRASIIPDGHHVDFAAIGIAKKIMGERLFAITDAVTTTTKGPYRHQLSGDKYECNGTLSGSALGMHQAFYNLVHYAEIEWTEAHRMCSLYPARLIGRESVYGKIAPRSTGQFVLLDKQLKLAGVIT